MPTIGFLPFVVSRTVARNSAQQKIYTPAGAGPAIKLFNPFAPATGHDIDSAAARGSLHRTSTILPICGHTDILSAKNDWVLIVKPYELLRKWWDNTSAEISAKLPSASEVEELERRYAVTLPDDFRNYLKKSCPVEDAWDDTLGIWWGFGRIKTIPEEYDRPLHDPSIAAHADKYLFFVDHCIWCWAWAIACTNDENQGKVAIIGGDPKNPDRFVANSFAEFVEAYTSDFGSVC